MAVDNKPLMPKATAVWLVDNTSLSFDQIADFCGLHPLEVKNPATGEITGSLEQTSTEELSELCLRARAAQPNWEAVGFTERARVLSRFHSLLFERSDLSVKLRHLGLNLTVDSHQFVDGEIVCI